jgi:uncharacterized membrane protein (Fun14 family)
LQISLPLWVLIGIIILYFAGTFRSLFALLIGKRIVSCLKMKYRAPYELDSLDKEQLSKLTKKEKKKRSLDGFKFTIYNAFNFVRNFIIWILKEPFTLKQNQLYTYKLINAYFSFISVFFIRIMTTSSQIFVCKVQPDGRFSLNASPDIFWFENPF